MALQGGRFIVTGQSAAIMTQCGWRRGGRTLPQPLSSGRALAAAVPAR